MKSMKATSLMKKGEACMKWCAITLLLALMVSCNGSDFFAEDTPQFPVTITLSGAISGTYRGFGSLKNGNHRYIDPSDDTVQEQDVLTLNITCDDGSTSVSIEVLLLNSTTTPMTYSGNENNLNTSNPGFGSVTRNFNRWNFNMNYREKFAEDCGSYTLTIEEIVPQTIDGQTINVPSATFDATAVPICRFLDQETVCTSPIIANSTITIHIDFLSGG